MTVSGQVAAVAEAETVETGAILRASAEVPASDWGVFAQTAIVGLLTVSVKAVGAAKTVFIAHSLGAGKALDAYLLAFLAPSFLCDVLSGAVAPSLIPALAQARHAGGHARACATYAAALYRSLLLLGGLSLIVGVAGWIFTVASGDTMTLRLLLVLLPMMPLSAVANVWRAILNAEGRFAVAAGTPALTPLITIAFLYSAGPQFLVASLAFGTTIGMAAEAAVLGTAVRRAGFPILPPLKASDRHVRSLLAQFSAVSASNLLTSGSALIDQSMAALLGAGSLSVLSYGTRLVSLLVAVGPAALSTTVLPSLSNTIARGEWTRLRTSVIRYLAVGAVVATPIALVLIWFSKPIVRVFLQRGAFTAADTQAVSAVQVCSLLQFPVSIGIAILTRLIASLRESHLVVPLSVAGLIGNAGLDYVLMHRFGVAGIAMASTLVNTFIVAALGIIANRRIGARVRNGN